MTLRAALYARFSSDDQNPRSADDQLAACRRLAEQLGATVVAEFKDEAISGTHDNRPGLQGLMAAANRRPRPFDLVIAESLDRMSRTGTGSWAAFEDLAHLEIPLHTIEQGRLDEVLTGAYAMQSALFIKGLRAKVKRGLEAVVRSGRYPGKRPYGYRIKVEHDARGERIKGLIEIDETEAAVVRRIASEIAAGATSHAVALRLNKEGVPGPRGGFWDISAIAGNHGHLRGVLRNPVYVGEIVWNRTRQTKDRRTGRTKTRINAASERVTQPAPELRIVDQATWDQAQANLEARSAAYLAAGNPSAANTPKRLLSSLVRCGLCGGGMHLSGPQRSYYCLAYKRKGAQACPNRFGARADQVEPELLRRLRAELLHPELVEEFVAEYLAASAVKGAGARARRDGLARELADVAGKLRRLVDQVAEGVLEGRTVAAKIGELEARRSTIDAELARLDASAEVVAFIPNGGKRYRDMLEDLTARLSAADQADATEAERDAARAGLRQLVKAVRIHPGDKPGAWTLDYEADVLTFFAGAEAAIAAKRAAS